MRPTHRSLLTPFAVIAALCAALSANAADFTFAALGDTPYNAEEEARFIGIIAEMNREPLEFVVHVGDFKAAITRCSDELFRQRKDWFALVRHPFIFVPGDNEWTDCRRILGGGHDPLERMQKLRELFFAGDSSLGQRTIRLERQGQPRGAQGYPEHARWEHENVLFVTLNAPGPDNHSRAMPEEFSRRNAAQLEWLAQGFRRAAARKLRAVVVVWHADPWNASGEPRRGFGELLAALTVHTRAFPGEVLLIHGDTHAYRVDQPLRAGGNGAPLANFTRLEVFGSPFANWVRVKVIERAGRVRFEMSRGG